MNKWIAVLAIGIFAASLSLEAQAQRRLGGGMSFGKPSQSLQQRQATPPQKQQAPQQAAPAQQPSAASAPAAAGARAASPWRGALMGLAAASGWRRSLVARLRRGPCDVLMWRCWRWSRWPPSAC